MRAGRLAWSLFAVSITVNAVGLALLVQVPAVALRRENDTTVVLSAAFVLVLLVFGLVGAVVASRLPANPVGWLFLALATSQACYQLASGYTHFSLQATRRPAADYTAWLADWTNPLSPVLLGFAFLLFPDGRLISPRWRPVAWCCAAAVVPVVVSPALAPGPLSEFPSLRNPLGLAGAQFLHDLPVDIAVAALLVLGGASILVRFRGSRGVERQQLKWFTWSAGLLVGLLLVAAAAESLTGGAEGTADEVGGLVWAAVFCALPVSAGMAILRYGLYEIDVVINRTLVYGAVTATLVMTYLVSVLVLRLALDPITGDSDIAVAASTLAAAALFRPLRARIQLLVDRRFYRSRYDASQTLEAFTRRLRDQIDLEALGTDLRAVVLDTVHPAHVSLWLREVS
jgi:hypothetical protein